MLMSIDDLWSHRFGLELSYLLSPGIVVINNEQTFLKGYNGAWIFRRRDSWICCVPPELISLMQHAVSYTPTEQLHTEETLHAIFGTRVDRIIGPAFQGYADLLTIHACTAHPTRQLTSDDGRAIADLLGACTPLERELSTIAPHTPHLFGAYANKRLMAAATWVDDAGGAAIGVLTHPSARGNRFGASAVSAAVLHALESGFLPLYQTLLSNEPSIRLAARLGISHYGTHVAVRFH
jgi:hypothetical protein